MKTAKEWLQDARQARQFEDMMSAYEIYDGELQELAGGFWNVQLDNMNMAGLEPNEYSVCEAFILTDNVTDAAASVGCSTVWFNTLLKRACRRIDDMLKVTTKYTQFKDAL